MKFNNLKVGIIVVFAIIPVGWAALLLSEDRSGNNDTSNPSVHKSTPQEEARSSTALKPRLSRRHQRPVPFSTASETAEPEESPAGFFEEDVAAALQAAQEQERKFVRAFETQSVDHNWAQERESALSQYIDRDLSESEGFSHSDVECRSNKCLATVTYEDYGSASATLGVAADLTKGECATVVFMPPPEDTSESYTHKIRLGDCVSSADL